MMLVAAVAWQGCLSADFRVPTDAIIVCDGDRDCPDGWICPGALQVCIEPSNDILAPAFVAGSNSVTPAAANQGSAIIAAFEVTEALAFLPVVRLEPAPESETIFEAIFELTGGSAPEYSFTYDVTGDEPEQLYSVLVDLVDEAGNVVTLTVGQTTIDFTAPSLVGTATVTPAPPETAGCGNLDPLPPCDTVTLEFVVSELLSKADARLNTTPARALIPSAVDGVNYTFTYLVAGDEPEGLRGIQIELTDLAGNTAQVSGGDVSIDHLP